MTLRPILQTRTQVRRAVQTVFDDLGFLEVDTPVLSAEVLPETHIDPVRVPLDGGPAHYLQASPEALMKRLLAGGSGPIYQFARSFRAGERGARHDVEFVLLEWYAPGATLDDTAPFLARLCEAALGTTGIERTTCRDAFLAHAGIDPFSASLAEWRSAGGRAGAQGDLPRRPADACRAAACLRRAACLQWHTRPRLRRLCAGVAQDGRLCQELQRGGAAPSWRLAGTEAQPNRGAARLESYL